MNKFTPGPWKVSKTHPLSGDIWYVITNANDSGPIMDVGGKDESGQIAEAKYLITDPKEIEANARLIAAAPRMFDFIENLVANQGEFSMLEAMQLIDDAKGES